jgi:DNA-binding NarL/FixJ family response regulator
MSVQISRMGVPVMTSLTKDDVRDIKVLIVDDDAQVQRPYLSLIVQQRVPEAAILEAGSPDDAIRVIDANPDLTAAVVDLCLPDKRGQAGLDVLQYLRTKAPECMRILVTSLIHERDVRDRSNAEAFVHIHDPKGSQRSLLGDALSEALRRHWRRLETASP